MTTSKRSAARLLAVVLAIAPLVVGQSPNFDAVSIKLSEAGANGLARIKLEPTRVFYDRITAHDLIKQAYGMLEWQLSGGPEWINSEAYSIEATTAQPESEARIHGMLRAMLANRFGLVIGVTQKETNVYRLMVGPSGSKLVAQEEGANIRDDFKMQNENAAVPRYIFAHSLSDVFLQELERMGQLDRHIIDSTGLTGKNYLIGFNAAPAVRGANALSQLLDSDMGLVLKADTAMVDMYAIQKIRHPDPN